LPTICILIFFVGSQNPIRRLNVTGNRRPGIATFHQAGQFYEDKSTRRNSAKKNKKTKSRKHKNTKY